MKVIPISEIQRNKRVEELMQNRVQKKKEKPLTLTHLQMEKVFELKAQGYSREEAVKIVLESNIN